MDKKVLLAAALMCVSGIACAQDNPLRPTRGAKEIGISVDVSTSAGHSAGSVMGSLGYYLTSSLVLQTTLSVDRSSGSPSSTLWFLGARYEFSTPGQFAPYLLAGLLTGDDGGKTSVTSKVGVGANYYFRPTAALFTEVSFRRFGTSTNTTTTVDVGFRLFFK